MALILNACVQALANGGMGKATRGRGGTVDAADLENWASIAKGIEWQLSNSGKPKTLNIKVMAILSQAKAKQLTALEGAETRRELP
ncbi:hypothetical protein M744_00905 [Synechococcus elongatus UTEX 2973]|nr:hypothetical protein M744_00905 [Synechococcus elongatus UTEX 2973]